MGHTYLSKIPTISSNPHTIILLLIVGEFGYPEVGIDRCEVEWGYLSLWSLRTWLVYRHFRTVVEGYWLTMPRLMSSMIGTIVTLAK